MPNNTWYQCLGQCTLQQLGVQDLAAGAGLYLGKESIPKSGGLGGSSSRTSVLSTVLRDLTNNAQLPWGTSAWSPTGFPWQSKFWTRTTKSLGGFVGRWIPVAGGLMLAYDGVKIAICTKECVDNLPADGSGQLTGVIELGDLSRDGLGGTVTNADGSVTVVGVENGGIVTSTYQDSNGYGIADRVVVEKLRPIDGDPSGTLMLEKSVFDGTGKLLSGQSLAVLPTTGGGTQTFSPQCFLAGTEITMADGTKKPIEEIVPGNMVMAFDEKANNGMGALVPSKVTRTLPGIAQDIIDLRGLRVTPGHRFLSDNGEWVSIADCLIEDRAIVEERDGKPVYIRTRTGAVVGSTQDVPLLVVFNDPATAKPRGAHVRAGIPWMGQKRADGTYEIWDFARFLEFNNYKILTTGHVIDPDGIERDSVWWPEQGTPLDSAPQRDWVVKLEGQPFMPQWIADVAALDKEGRQTVNGSTRLHMSSGGPAKSLPRSGKPSSFTPAIVGGGASAGAMNRKSRRKQVALTRVK